MYPQQTLSQHTPWLKLELPSTSSPCQCQHPAALKRGGCCLIGSSFHNFFQLLPVFHLKSYALSIWSTTTQTNCRSWSRSLPPHNAYDSSHQWMWRGSDCLTGPIFYRYFLAAFICRFWSYIKLTLSPTTQLPYWIWHCGSYPSHTSNSSGSKEEMSFRSILHHFSSCPMMFSIKNFRILHPSNSIHWRTLSYLSLNAMQGTL